ncbi:MAG: hypothetical protein CMF62_00220 [Magnetococcales bacterium]|nr:hypothetical protein [Magnetococcales bacterium]|tara:strand:+ start:18353 stop:19834 length:1482 start_codon:yes stop_codon:yes gene_type:complete
MDFIQNAMMMYLSYGDWQQTLTILFIQLLSIYLPYFLEYSFEFIYDSIYPDNHKLEIFSYDKTGRLNEIYLRLGVYLNKKLNNVKNMVCDDWVITDTELIGINEFEILEPEITVGEMNRIRFDFDFKKKKYSVYVTKSAGKIIHKKSKDNDNFSQKDYDTIFLESYDKDSFEALIKLSTDYYKEVMSSSNGALFEYSLDDDGQYTWGKSESIFTHRDKIILKKTKENIFLPKDVEMKVDSVIENFLNSEEKYSNYGIPYKLGLMIEGIPGTGKTSLTYYLANKLKRHIYRVNNSVTASDILKIKSSIPPYSIVLFDDIDMLDGLKNRAVKTKNNINKNDNVLHNMMKLMDAYNGLHGCIVVMTTNYISKLDSALIRPGRIDHIITLNHADKYQMNNIFKKFYNKELNDSILEKYENVFTTSNLINRIILANLDSYDDAVNELEFELERMKEKIQEELELIELENELIDMDDDLDDELDDELDDDLEDELEDNK